MWQLLVMHKRWEAEDARKRGNAMLADIYDREAADIESKARIGDRNSTDDQIYDAYERARARRNPR